MHLDVDPFNPVILLCAAFIAAIVVAGWLVIIAWLAYRAFAWLRQWWNREGK